MSETHSRPRLRLAALAVFAIVTIPLVAACNTSPGAAALVGDKRIATSDLQSQVNDSIAGGQLAKQPGFSRASFTRELLAHLINVDVLNALAAQRHVTLTRQDVSAQMASFVQQAGSVAALKQQAAQGGVTAKQLPGFVRFAALQKKVGDNLVATLPATRSQLEAEYRKDIDQYDQLEIAQIAVTSKTLAQNILHKVKANPASFASLAAKDSTDTATKAKGGLVGYVGRSQVAGLLGGSAPKPGTFRLAHSTGQYVVLHIIRRRVLPLSAVEAQVKTALFSSQEGTVLQSAVTAEAKKIGVRVSPRYGHWDLKTESVVATSSPVSSPG